MTALICAVIRLANCAWCGGTGNRQGTGYCAGCGGTGQAR
jgi:hypothetical protein